MGTYRRILLHLKPYWATLGVSVFCSLMYSVFSGFSIYLTIPLLETLFHGPGAGAPAATQGAPGLVSSPLSGIAGFIQGLVLRDDPVESLFIICIIVVVTFLLKNIFGYIQSTLMTYVEHGVIRDMRNAVYQHIHRLPLAFFSNERTGGLISRVISDIPVIISGISATFFTSVREPLLIVAYLTIALSISWKLTLISFIVLPFILALTAAVGLRVHRESGLVQERIADVTSVLQETISGVKVVKAFGMEKFESQKFGAANQGLFRTVFKVTKVRNLSSPLSEFLGAVAGAVVIWYGGLEVLGQGALRASEFLGFLFANDDLVLADISATVAKGEVVAIVGPSGAGKSTLVDLIPRFYDPTWGSITIDGVDLRAAEIATLRSLIGIVTQETILFNDTVRNNIAYGLQDYSLERVVGAAKAANAHRFIMEMPKGYESVIGERGVKISGGERQRVALARAILKNPPILILDEATSALDTESEMLVQEAIENLMAGRTSIVIAHRLSTVQHADRILVLEAGRIVESGKHDDLVRVEHGLYRKLHDLQFRL
ncbi:MAG: antibiotic transporter ATP-binding protein [Bacteroidetes bacterium]|nr:antibiotic transporter ATP-binding protein [Bacteroidota bacterium]